MVKDQQFTSSYVAKTLGISKASVSLWVNVHLPNLPKNKMGYRLFSQKDIKHLERVQNSLKDGYTHEEVKNILSNNECADINTPEFKTTPNKIGLVSESSTLDFILDNMDIKASFTNEAFKQLLKRCISLEEENKRLIARI